MVIIISHETVIENNIFMTSFFTGVSELSFMVLIMKYSIIYIIYDKCALVFHEERFDLPAISVLKNNGKYEYNYIF